MAIKTFRKMSADSDFVYLSEAFGIQIWSMNPDANKLVCFCNSVEAAYKFCGCIEQALEIETEVEQKGEVYYITLPFQFSY
ncbi:MAG: hypothetical protein VKL42_08830 [Snowella sp.]|nr:hypothetical protein [Snowella sp.]